MRSYSISVEVNENIGSLEGRVRVEISGLDITDNTQRKGEMISLLFQKIKEYGDPPPASYTASDRGGSGTASGD